MEKATKLTQNQKLQAIHDAFYLGGIAWNPKKGDFYTLVRNDLELYRIVDEDDDNFYTAYCHIDNSPISKWSKDAFLEGFGKNRIFVPLYILSQC